MIDLGKWPTLRVVGERVTYLELTADLISEHADQRGGEADESHYDRAYRIEVFGGGIEVHEGSVEPLRLPDEFFDWQCVADRFSEQGVSADRLRGAFAHLVG